MATFSWDMRTDRFKIGQWLKGRIYERRSDLSPDGKYLIYFAMTGHRMADSGGSWTAISIAPYLKAIAFFPKNDCWHGGGLWTGNRSYWLNDGPRTPHVVDRVADELNRTHNDPDFSPQFPAGECTGVYYDRLVRSGWTYGGRFATAEIKNRKWWDTHEQHLFSKDAGNGWLLEKIAHAQIGSPPGKGCYWDEHRLTHSKSGRVIAYRDWEWAEVDRNTVVWAAEGKLFRGWLGKDGIRDMKMLIDLNDKSFEAIKAPY